MSGAEAAVTPIGGILQQAATANGNGTTLAVGGTFLVATFTVSGTFVATVNFEGEGADASFQPLGCILTTTSTPIVSSTTTTGAWQCNVTGFTQLRARISGYVSGAVTVGAQAADAGASIGTSGGGGTSNLQLIAGATIQTGTGASGTGTIRVATSSDSQTNASQAGTWTMQPGNTPNTTPWLMTIQQGGNPATVNGSGALTVNCITGCSATSVADATATGALGASNAAVTVALAGDNGASVQFATGTLAGSTIVAEISTDGATTWSSAVFADPVSGAVSTSLSNPSAAQYGIVWGIGGVSHVRVRVSVYGSGTVTGNVRATVSSPFVLTLGSDGTNLRPLATTTGGVLKVDLSGTAANATAIKVDASATTQPVSCSNCSGTVTVGGTVTANIGSAGTLALDASVTGLSLAQASSTSGQKGALAQGAVTTANPAYTTGQTDPLSLDTIGGLRVHMVASDVASGGSSQADAASFTQNSSAVTIAGCEYNTSVSNLASGTAGSFSCTNTRALNVNIVNGSAVIASLGTTLELGTANVAETGSLVYGLSGGAGVALSATGSGALYVAGAPGSGFPAQGLASNTPPIYGPNQVAFLSLTELGALRVDPSGSKAPLNVSVVSGNNTASVNTSGQMAITCSNCSGSGASAGDNSVFVAGSTSGALAMGVYDDAVSTPTSGNAAAARLTQNRALHVNLRDIAGAALGVAALPLQVSLANTAANGTAIKVDNSAVTQPISCANCSGTVTVSVSGTQSQNVAQVNGTTVVTAGVAGMLAVGGPSAEGGSATGNPVLMGGYYSSSLPAFANTQAIALKTTSRGVLLTDLYDSAGSELADSTNHALTVVGKGSAGTPVGGILTVQGNASGTPIPVSASISLPSLIIAPDTPTAVSGGPLMQGAVSRTPPIFQNGRVEPMSLTTLGALRVDGSGIVQPVSGTVIVNQAVTGTDPMTDRPANRITSATTTVIQPGKAGQTILVFGGSFCVDGGGVQTTITLEDTSGSPLDLWTGTTSTLPWQINPGTCLILAPPVPGTFVGKRLAQGKGLQAVTGQAGPVNYSVGLRQE